MGMGNRLVDVHDHMERENATLEESLAALNWTETEIRRKPQQHTTHDNDNLPF